MANTKLVGENYSTPELRAKVTGRSRYAEDFRADGMLFTRLVLSPYAHARIKSIDTSAALASMLLILACAYGLRTNRVKSIPSARKSSAYLERPVTFARNSGVE